MKHNYSSSLRRTLSAVLLLLVSTLSWAADFKEGGIYYNINVDGKSVTVTSNPEKYSGDISIPSTVVHEGKKYGVTGIGNMAFALCDALTSISLPEGLTSIGDTVFWGCTSLPSIDFPSSLTRIGNRAFATCHSLASVDIPSGVTNIGEAAFGGCTSLASVMVSADNTVYDSREGCNAIIEIETNTLIAGCRNTVIPEGVTGIADYAFVYCISLTSIDIPSGVTSIGDGAFYGCSSLASVDIPEGVTSIGGCAFSDCTSLASVDIPEGVTSIGACAFSDCTSLASVDIPFGVTSIGDGAFYGCSSLATVICRAEKVPWYDYLPVIRENAENESEQQLMRVIGTFSNVPLDKATLYVPASAIEAYKAVGPWKDFGTILPLEDYRTGAAHPGRPAGQ